MGKYAKTALIFFLIVFVYFLYKGVSTPAWEGDSLAYHIPIAKNILEGKLMGFESLLEYYPAAAELMLAGFMHFNIPLNLYNLVGWILLIYISFKLGIHFGLRSPLALIAAVSIGLINSVTRLISTQTVDIWLAVFYLLSVFLLEKPKKQIKYFLLLGIALGFVIGSKYSGPLFIVPLVFVYGKKMLSYLSVQSVWTLLPITVLGFSWYVRNWIFMGDPIYPANELGFKLLNWQLWKTGLLLPGGMVQVISALVSEYLIWALVPILALKFPNSRLKFLGFANLAICLFLPTWPENLISDLRYTFIAFIPLIINAFQWFQKNKQEEKIVLLAIISMVSVLPQLDYFPKLFAALAFLVFLFRSAPSRN